jgi:hypothetical protein
MRDGFYGFRNLKTYLSNETKTIANNISKAPAPDIKVNPSPNIKYEITVATTTSVNKTIVDVTEEMCLSPFSHK